MQIGPQPGAAFLRLRPRTEPIRRRTLIALRWVAVAGQLAAMIAALMIGVHFAVLPAFGLVALAAVTNFWLSSQPSRMTQAGATWQLVFDLIQISALIGLTGGLSNPFALLVLAPVTIAATALQDRQTIVIGIVTIVMISLAGWFAIPLRHPEYNVVMSPVLRLSHWAAIVIGVVFFATYARRVSSELAATAEALLSTQMALDREQKLQHLGGVIAAAAHEMGTPLATIKLIAGELRSELPDALPLRTDLLEDARILTQSADRCRDILRSMGRAGKDDLLLHAAPVKTVLEEAAEPHANRGKRVEIATPPDSLTIRRDPGVIHGLRNIIQNAVDFAASTVHIDASLHENMLIITVSDDGPGFSPAMIGSTKNPTAVKKDRPHYEGMGLGLFIAQALLEGSGAEVTLKNSAAGAVVSVTWPLVRIRADDRAKLDENPTLG